MSLQRRASLLESNGPSFSRDNTSKSSGGGGASSSHPQPQAQPEIDWVALGVELVLRVSIAFVSGYLLHRLTQLFQNNPMLGTDDQQDQKPVGEVYRRLSRILRKRAESNNNNNNKDEKNRKTSSPATIEIPHLTSYERQMAEEILDPDDIESGFADIGGLDSMKKEIYELAVLPLVMPHLFQGSKLVQPSKGILLYGKPGTGKTMLAKALAKEARAVFLPLQLSKILNKWVGESNKLIAATFSLANKLQPAIIFIDELDTFLKASTSETAYLDAIKAEFLTLWDGVATAGNNRVLVLGATNRPQSIDLAILRRMPRTFQVPLPDENGRLAILQLLLQDENVEKEARDFLPHLARLTSGYSGSDLKEVCKTAAMVGIQERTAEFSRKQVMGEIPSPFGAMEASITTLSSSGGSSSSSSSSSDEDAQIPVRPISKDDLLTGLQKVTRTGATAKTYGKEAMLERRTEEVEEATGGGDDAATSIDATMVRNLAFLLRALSSVDMSSAESNGAHKNNNGDDDDIPQMR